jgi:hypothetical protein
MLTKIVYKDSSNGIASITKTRCDVLQMAQHVVIDHTELLVDWHCTAFQHVEQDGTQTGCSINMFNKLEQKRIFHHVKLEHKRMWNTNTYNLTVEHIVLLEFEFPHVKQITPPHYVFSS